MAASKAKTHLKPFPPCSFKRSQKKYIVYLIAGSAAVIRKLHTYAREHGLPAVLFVAPDISAHAAPPPVSPGGAVLNYHAAMAAGTAPEHRSVGTLVHAYRIRGGYTQRELASQLGLTDSSLNRIERGRSMPRLSTIAKLGRVFGEQAYRDFLDARTAAIR